MPKRKSSSKPASSPWKAVDVHLGDDDNDESHNHYDDEKLSKKALQDLPVAPGEDVGIFLGLEVLRGDHYHLVKQGNTQRLVVKEEPSEENKKVTTKQKPEPAEQACKKSKTSKEETQESSSDQVMMETSEATPSSKSRKKKKKKETKQKNSESNDFSTSSQDGASEAKGPLHPAEDLSVDPDQLVQVQQSWSQATGGAVLHPRLLTSLHRLEFSTPTPIQAATLSAAILGRRNLVGAAPTGSGKTLAFLLPILQHILDHDTPGVPVAMIVTPTRELTAQIHQECDKLLPNQCVSLVGGIALVKQERLLQTKRPPIIIGTPGRMWAMVSQFLVFCRGP
jgi:ATP-dependent RNA helicase DDX24/MAK5